MLKFGDRLQGRYEIKEVSRGIHLVYIAFGSISEKLVTIETPRNEGMNRRDLIEGFLEQSQIVMKLRECPHIIRAEHVAGIGNKPYIFWEYVYGWTLREEIQNNRLDLIRFMEA